MKNDRARVEVGLTGGIAAGKSEVSRVWRDHGIPVLDTDRVAHEVMMPGTAVYDEVRAAFGEDMVENDGRIDRSRLGALVFADPQLRQRLNRLIHPAVHTAWQAWRDERRAAGEHAVVAIPLLFEVGVDRGWDAIVCVSAPQEFMMQRLMGRGLGRDEAERRIAAQLPVEEKARRSDYVIENNGTLDELAQAAMTTWRTLIHCRID